MTQINEERINETPLEDLRKQALNHYEEASRAISHWSSFVRDAIKAYDPKRDEEVERLKKEYNALGVKFDKELERWQERDVTELEKRQSLERELDTLKKQVEELKKEQSTQYVPYQICPVCNGNGMVPNFLSSSTYNICIRCNGNKTIPMHKINQPLT